MTQWVRWANEGWCAVGKDVVKYCNRSSKRKTHSHRQNNRCLVKYRGWQKQAKEQQINHERNAQSHCSEVTREARRYCPNCDLVMKALELEAKYLKQYELVNVIYCEAPK